MSKLLKQLKQQLEEKDKALEEKDKEIENLNFALRVEKNYYTNSYKQNERLKQQLASQRNEIYETVIKAMTKHWEDIMSKSGWWLNCGKCEDMEKFFKSVIIDNKIPLT